jgi:guanylate kinase
MKSLTSNPCSPVPVPPPLVIVLSGPSGAGKDAVLNLMKGRSLPLSFIVTSTTRPQRPGEVDNVHYHFVSRQEFNRLIEEDELLEHAEVYGNYYGVPKEMVRQSLAQEKDVIIKVDVQGAMTIRQNLPDAVLIFLMPPSLEELARRLKGRGTEAPKDLDLRLSTARSEIDRLPEFDYAVMSYENRLEEAVTEIEAIIHAEKLRVTQREYIL